MCPMKKMRIRDTGVPWMNREIIELIQDKNKAWKKARLSESEEDKRRARKLRNQVINIIDRAKKDLFAR